MFYADDLTLHLSRGDTGKLTLTLTDEVPAPGTPVVFSIKARPGGQLILEKEAVISDESTVEVPFSSEDTASLAFGTYYWDLRIFDGASVITPMRPARFMVEAVVGNDR